MSSQSMKKLRCYNEISLLLNYTQRLYEEYLNSNKKFIYASILRDVNGRLYERLHKNLCFIEQQSHLNVIELMLHLDVWITIWDYEHDKKKPLLEDMFTFNNDMNFPIDNVNKLLSELVKCGE